MCTDQLTREEREKDQVEHSISSLQHDVARLNSLITEKKGQQDQLEQGTVLLENDFIHALKVIVKLILCTGCAYIYLHGPSDANVLVWDGIIILCFSV